MKNLPSLRGVSEQRGVNFIKIVKSKLKHKTKIPVVVVTGFLGAGKTTFINHLLERYAERKFALVENEFGDVAIDTKLIKGVDASQMFELKQGCICCTITDEYELVLKELAHRFPDVENLLIETTGLADPAPVIRPFFHDSELRELYEYTGTICLVDAVNYDDHPEKDLRLKQMVVSDMTLVNKAEWISAPDQEKMQQEIGKMNPFAKIYFTDFGIAHELDIDHLQQKIRTGFEFVSFRQQHDHIQTRLIYLESSMTKAEFLRRFSYVMDVNKRNIYRAKGVLYFQDEPFEYILQGVGGSFELIEGNVSHSKQQSRVVIIGKELDKVNI